VTGQTLGHYRIESKLGAGGMGVVYQAVDSRLGRKVAIKLLHEEGLKNPDRLARFEREARLLAALNHPNIAAIHGLEEAGEQKFLVLEYVPGDTLAERLARGPLPVREALEVGRQVAEALAAAHEAGVIHRDLKPANIKITPEGKVKVLDFGLAKALEEAGPVAQASDVAQASACETLTAVAHTREGVVMGTAPYMSPEQAEGKPVDRRTDLWAFGCVLYEALTGRRTFPGDSSTEVLVGILDREPEWTALPAATPESVRNLLRRCLAKDPRNRLHDAADARLELEDTLAGRLSGPVAVVRERRWGRRVWAAAVAGLLIGAVAAGLWVWRAARPAEAPQVVRFSLDVPPGARIVPTWDVHLTFSRDSKTLLYPVNFPPPNVIYARHIDALEGKPLPEAKGLGNPLYSPDGRWILMPDYAKGSLMKLPLTGGAPVPIAPIEQVFRGDWGADGHIYWTNQMISGVIRTPDNGGKNEPVTELDQERQERNHRFAKLLPGGKALMFTVASGGIDSYNDARIDMIDLATKKRKPLVQGGTCARYAPSGHIVYARAGSLYAVPFDHRRLEVTGTPVKVVDGVLMSTNIGTAYFDISPAGDLAYAAGPAENGERVLDWVDRRGKATPLPLPPRSYLNPRISPDGKTLAVEVEGVNHDFYTYDFARAVMSRMTNDGLSHAPIWSPDGKRIAFRTWKGGKMTMAWMPADRSGPEESLVNYTAWQSAVSFSPDGKYLAFDQIDYATGSGFWILPLAGDRQPRPFAVSKFPTGAGKFSPDGKWVVYCSMESGRPEIYVQPWPGPGAKIQISAEGGTDPMWRRDGKEIFYRNASKMMAVPVSTGASFQAGRPQLLWEGEYMHGLSSSCGFKGVTTTSYDISPDGQRFLMIKDNDQNMYATRIVVVVNWVEELKRIMVEAGAKKT
jgi:serine/threonine-protein kinase